MTTPVASQALLDNAPIIFLERCAACLGRCGRSFDTARAKIRPHWPRYSIVYMVTKGGGGG
jgi:hypothetical protein